MLVKRKHCIAYATLCLCMIEAHAQLGSTVSRVANMFANTEICAQNYPARSAYFFEALDIWKARNPETYQHVRNYPDFKKIVSDARRDMVESPDIRPKTLSECIGYANSIKAIGEGYL